MNPEKLIITREARKNGPSRITALFNPEKYTLTKGSQFAEIAIPGLDSPVLQFVRGQNEKIAMELFFDTTENGLTGSKVKDVREATGQIYDLLKIDGDTHAPPRCTLSWGGALFSFGSNLAARCVLESVSEEFTLFSPEGIPLRARLNVSFREYKTVEEQIKEIGFHSPDRTRVRAVQRGETLALIAYREYGDGENWRAIADRNGLDHPRRIFPGQRLVIPRLDATNQS